MSTQPVFLQLNADDWHTCLDESLVFLRASWAQDWIGLPQVLQACMGFLNVKETQLSAAAGSMLAAAMDVASESELRFQADNRLEEPHYHNRLHTADVVTTLSLLMAIEAKLSDKHEPDWLAAGLLAAVAHDFMHTGGVNQDKCQIELLSCMYMSPIFSKHAVPELWVQRIETAIVQSDFSLSPHNHQRVQNAEFEWNQAWFNVLLNEADILPSSTPALGPSLSEALSREWMLIGFEAHKTVATAQGREAFLRSLVFSSAASRVLQASQRRQAQLAHAHLGHLG